MLRRLRKRRSGPLLSVVVPVHNVEQYVGACLDSIRSQHYRSIEIVVVDDGSPDDSMAIVRRHAAKDSRIRLVERPNGGLSAARNTGVEAATGQFLTFVDSDDLVTAGGLAAAMASLAETGSDIAVLQYGRLRDGKPAKGAPWIRRLHAEGRTRATLDDCPDVMFNASAWSKVFRRDFYDSAGLRFVEGVVYEDQAFSAEAYAKAQAFDVLETTGYLWRVNESSMSQGPGQVTVDSVLARLDAADNTLKVLADRPAARAERALQYLRSWLANSLLKLERADAAYLDALVQRMPAIVEAAPPDRYALEVPAQYRVLYALLAAGDRDAIWRYVRAEGMQPEMHPSGMEPAGLTAYLPGWQHDPVPPEAYVLTAEQTRLRATVRAVHHDGANLVLDVAAWFPNVELTEPSLTLKTDGDRVDVVQWGEPKVVTSRQGAQRQYARSGWSVTIRGAARRAPRNITVTLRDGSREGTVTATIPR
jgi:glycosyltransferase involved in cell wall biosynthesis